VLILRSDNQFPFLDHLGERPGEFVQRVAELGAGGAVGLVVAEPVRRLGTLLHADTGKFRAQCDEFAQRLVQYAGGFSLGFGKHGAQFPPRAIDIREMAGQAIRELRGLPGIARDVEAAAFHDHGIDAGTQPLDHADAGGLAQQAGDFGVV
jgi:hypothetical protein